MVRIRLLSAIILSLFTTHAHGLEQLVVGKAGDFFPKIKHTAELQEQELATLRKDRDAIERAETAATAKIKQLIEDNRNEQLALRGSVMRRGESEFTRQKSNFLTETSELLEELKEASGQHLDRIDEQIKLLNESITDLDLSKYRQEHKLLKDRTHYSLAELRRVDELIAEQKRLIAEFSDQEKRNIADIDSLRKAAQGLKDDLQDKLERLKRAAALSGAEPTMSEEELTDLERLATRYYELKGWLRGIRLEERERKSAVLALRLSLEQARQQVTSQYRLAIRPLVNVSDKELEEAVKDAATRRIDRDRMREQLQQERDALSGRQAAAVERLNQLTGEYDITLGTDVDEWSKEPPRTVNSYRGVCLVGAEQAKSYLLGTRKELAHARISLEELRYSRVRGRVGMLESYRKIPEMVQGGAIVQEINTYQKFKSDATAQLEERRRKLADVGDALTRQKRARDNIKKFREMFIAERMLTFRENQEAFDQCLKQLAAAERDIQSRIDHLEELSGVYTEVISLTEALIGDNTFIVAVLQGSSSLWQRNPGAILLEALQEAPSDILTFLSDVRAYVAQFEPMKAFARFVRPFQEPFRFSSLLLFLQCIMLFAGVILFARYGRLLSQRLTEMAQTQTGWLRALGVFLSAVIHIVRSHFWGIACFVSSLILLLIYQVEDSYIYILLCLALIPYSLYILRRFVGHLLVVNVKNNYIFLAEDYQRRFAWVLSFLLSATAIICLFRIAFMLADYPASKLPAVLRAVNFIIFQISLILIISKEQILYFIPTTGQFAQFVRSLIDRFYYVFLLVAMVIIILSHPDVGYGRLVLGVTWRLIQTGLLVAFLTWVHKLLKDASSHAFFVRSDEVVRERFSNAKTWYGLIIIVSFALLALVGFLIAAQVWNWHHITVEYLYRLWNTPIADLWGVPLRGADAQRVMSLSHFMKLLGILLLGFFVSYALNNFVFGRIFDLLPIDAGVQHTITSMTKYLVITVLLYMGLYYIGLGAIAEYIALGVLLAAGWVLKEPASDFVAYFIILVQRPIKLGDYIRVDNKIAGVVRRITPRAVILRRKNSTTIMVANSHLLRVTLMNWNYARTFIAFDDIVITVDYAEDVARVMELLRTAVEEHPNVLRNPRPVIRLDNFSEYGYQFMVRGFISPVYTLEQWNIASDVRMSVVAKLNENNIKIALPVRLLIKDEDKG